MEGAEVVEENPNFLTEEEKVLEIEREPI